jgi:hypothetical protein
MTTLPRHYQNTMFQREDNAAKWRQKNGIARVEGVFRDTQLLPHPSIGGLRGYDIPFREMIVEAYQAGCPAPEGMLRSIQRWVKHLIPYRINTS